MQGDIGYTSKDIEKLANSIIRWMLGLKPKYGKHLYYFEKYGIRDVVTRKFKRSSDGRTCPICGRVFPRRSALAAHMVQAHRLQIIEFIKSYVKR